MRLSNRNALVARRPRTLQEILAMAVALLLIFDIGSWLTTLLRYRASGLGFSDDSFYLVASLHGRNLRVMSTDFGIYTGAMLKIGGSLSGLRVVSLAIMLATTWFASGAFSNKSISSDLRTHLPRLFTFLALSAGSLSYFGFGILDASYNSLNAELSLVGVASVLRAFPYSSAQGNDHKFNVRWLLVTGWSAGVLLFIKPPAAIVLGGTAVLVVASMKSEVARRKQLLGLIGMGTIGVLMALLCHTILIGGKIGHDVERLSNGYQVLKSSNTYGLMGLLGIRDLMNYSSLVFSIVSIQVALWLSFRKLVVGSKWIGPASMIGCSIVGVFAVRLRPKGGTHFWGAYTGFWWLLFATSAMLWLAFPVRKTDQSLILGPFLVAGAIAAPFGSNNGVFTMSSIMGGYFVLAFLVHASTVYRLSAENVSSGKFADSSWFNMSISILAVSFAATGVMQNREWPIQPYELNGTLEQNSSTPIKLSKLGTVFVSREAAAYASNSRKIFETLPQNQRCTIVLTNSPFLYLLSDQTPHGYTFFSVGWNQVAKTMWSLDPCPGSQFIVVTAGNKSPVTALGNVRIVRELGKVRAPSGELQTFQLAERGR
jgi:hypothetical protein